MAATITATTYTQDELFQLPEADRFELADSQARERTKNAWSSYVAGRLYGRIDAFCEAEQLGWVFPEGAGYRCFADHPNKVRKADISFIRRERLSLAQATARGHLTVAPDLAVEVVSPNDLAYDVSEKVQEFLGAGVRLMWVVNPQARMVSVHRLHRSGTILRENHELEGEDVIPGFCCRVGDLSQPPAGVAGVPS
jgi:Uma2 family endonuclease